MSAGQVPVPFNRRLDEELDRLGSLLCVGLDPHPERTPVPVADYCRRIIDATIDYAAAFKPNSAFFEASGTGGYEDLRRVIAHIDGERLVVLDAKRGDIGSTAAAYARAAFGVLGADAVTVSPYLGADSVAPFLAEPGRGAFVLCHTSNPGAEDFQHLDTAGHPLYSEVARRVATWNDRGNAGLVVGATYPDALAKARELAPDLPLLVPGVGAQGGDLAAALAAGLDGRGRGLLISSSRSVFFADNPAEAARSLGGRINEARERGR